VFVKEVQSAVLEGHADIAVHSAKDLPSMPAPGLVIAAVPERGDARDALVGRSLAGLGQGATVATGSVRRRAQLAHLRPDLEFVELRGNIQTRLSKVPTDGALVMAVAALDRLGLGAQIAQALDPSVMLPQVAQGALAVECRDEDGSTRGLLSRIEHGPSRLAVDGERAFLRARRRLRPPGRRTWSPSNTGGVARASSPTSPAQQCCATPRSAAIRSLGASVARVLLDERGGSALLARS
jgi:hydroxymethylbilane synthase